MQLIYYLNMKIIGIVVTLALLSLLLVWWINFSLTNSRNQLNVVRQADPSSGQIDINKDPLDYTQEEIDQYEKYLQERSGEVNEAP
jgi:hypothetical protein